MLMQLPIDSWAFFFLESDESGKQEVAIIDETTARRYWSGSILSGRRFRMGVKSRLWVTVVVVVVGICQGYEARRDRHR